MLLLIDVRGERRCLFSGVGEGGRSAGQFMILAWNLWKGSPVRILVKKSAVISSVGQ